MSSATVMEMRTYPSTRGPEDFFELGDRTKAVIRPIRPQDADALMRFHERLSLKSVTSRYFYPHLELGAGEVAHLTEVDGRDRAALVVERDGELIAIGRYDRLVDPTQAEVAFVVADALQHHGLATMLLHCLAALARNAGIDCLLAEVLAENKAMLSVFRAAGYPTESTIECGTVELKMAISPVALALSDL
jgi:RimJ/RimL family protein N-acetyltransferase